MNYYSVSLPVHSQVIVLVVAENEDQALEIAEKAAYLRDAEPVDFSSDEAEIYPIEADSIEKDEALYGLKNGNIIRIYSKPMM